ncbi:hypothetical protein [Hymenobacter terrestris]|uniref:DUF4252 domain-containing protein n=1 Tax=Hymenobacter terrestris TaxID=2748310 RepID=A0ABX2Q7G0_9BACT|nr:hypothetical protein [Hymenobacter terrestris]NVO86177.1 hypothetical protein [Hymenobacter terrestris]
MKLVLILLVSAFLSNSCAPRISVGKNNDSYPYQIEVFAKRMNTISRGMIDSLNIKSSNNVSSTVNIKRFFRIVDKTINDKKNVNSTEKDINYKHISVMYLIYYNDHSERLLIDFGKKMKWKGKVYKLNEKQFQDMLFPFTKNTRKKKLGIYPDHHV